MTKRTVIIRWLMEIAGVGLIAAALATVHLGIGLAVLGAYLAAAANTKIGGR